MNDRFSADELSRVSSAAARRIDLAHTRPFHIGSAEVRPASREILATGQRQTLEPLMMQVLVALHSADGATLSRDDLIDACWGGRAISDDAISRVISRLRSLGGMGGFKIETIPKIGYRLVAPGLAGALPEADAHGTRVSPRLERRVVIAAGAAVAAAGAAGLLWQKPWKHRPPAAAAELLRRGDMTLRPGFPGAPRQAISFYEEAVRIDPLFAAAWGAMALAYTHVLEGYSRAEMAGVPGQLRSAARRALELDPGNADAQLALILVRPIFGNWAAMEARLRQFNARHPGHWLGMGRLATLLFDVGRLDEGVAMLERVLRIDPMLPVAEAYLINAMANSDLLQEAEGRLQRADAQWPGHPSLWTAHFKLLLYNGRPEAAAAFVMNPDLRPTSMTAEEIGQFARLALAAKTRRPGDVETSVDDFRKRALEDIHNVPMSAAAFALLGRPDLTFASLERYFFNQGEFGPPVPIEPFTRRYARELYSRPLAPLRSDPRFASILQRIRLEDYWRRTGSSPDYRQTAPGR